MSLWFLASIALADPTERPLPRSPPTIEGLVRRYADPQSLRHGGATLQLRNPHVARSVLRLDGLELGEVDPLGDVVVQGLAPGAWAVAWITPDGFARTSEAIATAPPPERSSRSSSR